MNLFVSSKITGTKDLHVCFFKSQDETLPLQLMKTYKIPYLQVFSYEDELHCACFKPISTSRYKKILKAAKSASLKQLEKHGQVLFPILGITLCTTLLGEKDESVNASRPHVLAFTRMKLPTPISIKTIAGKGLPRLFRKVTHGN